MNRPTLPLLTLVVGLWLATAGWDDAWAQATTSPAAPGDLGGDAFFRQRIEPLLKEHCLGCHSHAAEMEGGLTLDSRSGWTRGGGRGPAVVPGKPETSLLLSAVRHADPDLRMPPDRKLSAEQIDAVAQFVHSSGGGQ